MKMSLWGRLRRWRGRDSEIEDEIAAHLNMRKQDLVDRGESPERAGLHASAEFGNRALITEVTREVWGCAAIERFGRDLKFGLRSLAKHPGLTIAAVLIVALGVGANTAVFSVVNALLIKPLPYRDPDRIVDLSTVKKKTGENLLVSVPDFQDWHDQSTAFAAMSFYAGFSTPVKAGDIAEYAEAAAVAQEFFDVFRLSALQGRLFSAEDYLAADTARVAVIGESYWRTRCGSDPHVLGRTLRLSGTVLTVVGVLPDWFRFPGKTEIWLPLQLRHKMGRGAHNFEAVGRVKPGLGIGAVQSQMSAIAARLERQYPSSNRDRTVKVTPLRDRLVAGVRPSLLVLCGAVGMILLIACVNLAGILLVRASTRTREMAIRMALGASRWRLVLQLLAESAALAVPVGVVSLLLAYVGRSALLALAPDEIGRMGTPPFDAGVLAFTAGLSMLTSLLFGCVPAWYACRLSVNESLKQSGGRAVVQTGTGRLRACLVTGEIALSVVLLAAAGLLIKSFARLQDVDLGFRPENVLVMTASYPASGPADAREATRFYSRLVAGVGSIPGVTATGGSRSLPSTRGWSFGGHWVDRHPPEGSALPEPPETLYTEVTPGTFRALGVPLIHGRDFAESDSYDAPLVAVVNQALVRYAFPNQDPIGRIIICGLDERAYRGMRIVGVVGDVRSLGPASPTLPAIYMPNTQHPGFATKMHILARSTVDPASLAQSMRQVAHGISPDVPVKFTTLEASLAENMAAARFRALLLGVFAALALCLAVVGIYGVMAYLVAQRSAEIGVRMALGAAPGSVFGLVLREGLRLTLAGLLLGLLGAVATTRLLANLLFEVKPGDPGIYAGLSLLLTAVALAAVSVPAWRAARVDPVVALRQE